MRDWKYHCSVLGVREDASAKDVRKAYRKLALERHPDKHNNSSKSKEDFQQLNESYHFVMAAMIEGRKPAEPEPPKRPQPTVVVPRTAPARKLPSKKQPPQTLLMVSGVAAFLLLLGLSLVLTDQEGRELASKSDKRDLFPKAWCFISDGSNSNGVSEYWSQRVCEDRCKSMAASRDVTCTWSGTDFYHPKSRVASAPPPTIPVSDPKSGECSITVEPIPTAPKNSTFQANSESACRIICEEKVSRFPRAKSSCVWNGNEFRKQERYIAPKEEQPTFVAKPPSLEENPSSDRSVCFMSVVLPGNANTFQFPNDTMEECADRCIDEATAHPVDREVNCFFRGISVARHIPNATTRYLSEHPELAPSDSSMDPIGICSVEGLKNGKRDFIAVSTTKKEDCEVRCRMQFKMAGSGVEVTCSRNNKEFFRDTAR